MRTSHKNPRDIPQALTETHTIKFLPEWGVYGIMSDEIPHSGLDYNVSGALTISKAQFVSTTPLVGQCKIWLTKPKRRLWQFNSADVNKVIIINYSGQGGTNDAGTVNELTQEIINVKGRVSTLENSGVGGGKFFSVASTMPQADSTVTEAPANVTVTFNQYLDADLVLSTFLKILDSLDVEIPSTITKPDKYTAVLTPNSALAEGSYKLWISKDLVNIVGDKLSDVDLVYNFTYNAAPVYQLTKPTITATVNSAGNITATLTVASTLQEVV